MSRLPMRGAVAAIFAAGVAAACGHPEQAVIDKYFQAVNARDNQTLGSFALVTFDKKVDRWEIKGSSPEAKETAPLPDLVKKQKEIEAGMAANKKDYNGYNLDHLNEVTQIRELQKSGGKIPAKLQPFADDWSKFEAKERDYRGKLAAAKAAVGREKANMMISVGNVDDVEGLEGDVITKTVDLQLTIEGKPQPYQMTLKKYDVKPTSGRGKVISRWVISALQPK